MRGIGFPRLSAARAVLAGAAILAGAALRPTQGAVRGAAPPSDELAMAVPRIHPPAGSSSLGLPQPLPPSEAARIRAIFSLQRQGRIPEAVTRTAQLTDTTLLGHILADRLLSKPNRATAPALSDWLGRYADLPDACTIYALLRRRLPPGAALPPAPASAALAQSGAGIAEAGTGADAARSAFTRHQDATALRLGRAAFDRSRGTDGEAAYVAGLAAWRGRAYAAGARLFEDASLADRAGAPLRAAGAFWAARAHEQQGDVLGWSRWMRRAAAEPHTLHGMLARRTLGLQAAAQPAAPTLAEADLEAVAATPQGHRAFALLQVGEARRAEGELRALWSVAQSQPALSRALYLVAGAAGLDRLVTDLSGVADATLADLPTPRLRPRGGFHLSPALVYAVAHVESNFDSAAVSGAGAQGLMQLMPVAASALGPAASLATLHDPGQNLRLGQAYLAYLARPEAAGDNLLRVLASYNAGPNAVQRWAIDEPDPLLFIEAIPNDETRAFVARALTNLWGYAARFRQASPSLDAIAAGASPRLSAETWPRLAPVRLGLH